MTRQEAVIATAHHEAGHAVVAWRVGLGFKYVTVKPDANRGSLGHIASRFPGWFKPEIEASDRIRLHAERHIVMGLAGQLAEKKFLSRRPRCGMEGDNQNAADLALCFCGSEETATAFLKYCFMVARDWVNADWAGIQAVAGALAERETLTRNEVVEIIWAEAARWARKGDVNGDLQAR